MTHPVYRRFFPILIIAVLLVIAWYAWQTLVSEADHEGLISSNGRIEATEVDVASKFAGRVEEILVREGDFVTTGQVLATMQVHTLTAQLREAQAQRRQALDAVASAKAQVAMSESDKLARLAQVHMAEAELDAAKRRSARSEALARDGAASVQSLDDDQTRVRSAQASLAAAKAQVSSAEAAIVAASATVTSAESNVEAMEATIERIQSEIDDSQLKAPRDGRVQLRLAQPGEVLAAGGRVLNLLDLTDVYMTFFLPTASAGRVALGTEVRIVLDAAPDYVIPAKVSFVASSAQFTPKTVETASEREKLMFRVRAQIDPELLQQYIEYVKTGLPGVAWLRVDPDAAWPARLQLPAE